MRLDWNELYRCGGPWEGLRARFGADPVTHVVAFHDVGDIVITACDDMAYPNHVAVVDELVDCMSCLALERSR